MTKEEIFKGLQIVRFVLDIKINQSEPASLINKLSEIGAIQGLSAELMAYAEKDHNVKLHEINKLYDNKNATEKKVIFGDAGKYEIYYKTLAENYNKELHYQIDLLRTLVSYTKKDFETLSYSK